MIRVKQGNVTFGKKVTRKLGAPKALTGEAALEKAGCKGKYTDLLKKIEVEQDYLEEGAFADYGSWDATEYAGFTELPAGYWVYVYPNWYIFGETTAEEKPKD